MSDPRIKPRVPTVNWEHPLAKGLVGAWTFGRGNTVGPDANYIGPGKVYDITGRSGDPLLSVRSGAAGTTGGSFTNIPTPHGRGINCVDSFAEVGMVDHTAPTGLPPYRPVPQGGFTIFALVNFNTFTHTTTIFSQFVHSTGPFASLATVWNVTPNWGRPYFRILNSAGGEMTRWCPGSTITYGVWYKFVFVWRGEMVRDTGMEIWIDGERRDTYGTDSASLGGSPSPSAPMAIGTYYNSGYPTVWPGYADSKFGDVRFWNRPLSVPEISDLYSDSWSVYRQPEPALANAPAGGLFEFDQLTGGMPDLRGGMV